MKRTGIIILFLLICNSASAQLFTKERVKNQENFDKDRLTWGYFLGFNSYDFKFEYEYDYYTVDENRAYHDILVKTNIGFNVGLVGDLRINDYFNLRFEPGLYISRRELKYDESYFGGQPFNSSDLIREVNSTYIHFPLLLKASTKRINNFKPFVVGGFSTALNLSSNQDGDDNSAGKFRTQKSMLFYEVGFGIDFYLEWFKFSPSIRGVFAINDELVRDRVEHPDTSPWTDNIASMKTRGVFVNFTFQ
ncbi:type IX secretion/gliding motility protein PorT/SprT [Gelidibacter gilvus]|uniref:PorT family protein n=1 Tax=Gelidibacter gilvus TaxID=59602 RepID=A0A4Q0XH40_9FLAO|nr:porin family protein [Gelidibacter gilvus]RXJ46076.1 PorT family protein [Gelidibacter gilvus]